uniref:FAS1 domain-containing protein n=1 Tax=Gongylonema pulchrum TaxID=637853 RepID=A0A183F1F7_9BILA
LDGVATIGRTPVKYLSGTSIITAPTDALIAFANLTDLVRFLYILELVEEMKMSLVE